MELFGKSRHSAETSLVLITQNRKKKKGVDCSTRQPKTPRVAPALASAGDGGGAYPCGCDWRCNGIPQRGR
jgi:hypothetical protein